MITSGNTQTKFIIETELQTCNKLVTNNNYRYLLVKIATLTIYKSGNLWLQLKIRQL